MGNFLQYRKFDLANGIGVRNSLFVAGCSLKCKGCWNPESWNPKNGSPYTQAIEQQILEDLAHSAIHGLSILGGEPFDNTDIVEPLITKVRENFGETKTIWVWSGYTLPQLLDNSENKTILSHVDVLIEGPFVLAERDITLKFRGSKNQRVLNMPETLRTGTPQLFLN